MSTQRIDVPGLGVVEFPADMSDVDIAAAIKRNSPQRDPKAERADFLKRELLRSPPVAAARGVKDIIDTGAGFLSRLGGAGEQARVRADNAAGRAEFDKAAEGQFLPQLARVGGNIAATAPAVTALGGAVAPMLPRLGQAIRSGGMTTGAAPVGAVARAGDMGIRVAGGAAGGGVAAGMVNPEDAGAGAVIGALAPPVVQGLGRVGQAVGNTLRGPAQSPQLAQAVIDARQAGYVIPPTQARPTLGNRILEGFSGKITTAQNASARNQTVTNRLAAETLGLPGDTVLSPQVLNQVRAQAGQAYNAIERSGVITPGPAYAQALDRIQAPYRTAAQGFPNAPANPVVEAIEALRSPSFDASAAVAQLRNIRDQADTAFTRGERGAGRSLREGAAALEDAIEAHLQQIGNPQLLQEFTDARRLIAQTYSIEKALNPVTGTVDAKKLAAQVAKNRPLTGPVRAAAEFAAQFPKAAQTVEGMGSLPQTSPLDWALSGSLSALTANPLMMAGVAARPMARAAVLSGPVQNRLLQPPPSAMANALMDPEIQRLVLRGAPLVGTDR